MKRGPAYQPGGMIFWSCACAASSAFNEIYGIGEQADVFGTNPTAAII
jgi:hypothetical protein